MVCGKAAVEAGAVTHGAVRCSAWLGVAGVGRSQSARFELFQVDKFGRLDARLCSDSDELGRLEKTLGIVNGGPDGEMHNPVGVVLILENLIRPLSSLPPNVGCAVKTFSSTRGSPRPRG